jgi:hypothetical protein
LRQNRLVQERRSVDAAVAAALGLEIIGQLAGGEHGALRVRTATGTQQVLKVFGIERAARLETAREMTGHLATIGGAVTGRYTVGVVCGVGYSLHPLFEARVPAVLDDPTAAILLAQWELRQRAAPWPSDWPAEAERALRKGSPFLYAEHAAIRAAGGRAAELLDELTAVEVPRVLRAQDIVHGDYHHENVVVDSEGTATIIDWEDATPGDGRYDLVTLDFWAQVFKGAEVSVTAAARIREALAAEDPCAVAVLRAVFAVHQLWFNAAHRPSRLDECVERVEAHLAPSWRARA